jgi:hypothetical protein
LAWYRFRRTFRARVGGYLVVALLIGVVGGVAMGAIAGARRTQSAFPTSLAATRASDLQVQVYVGGCVNVTDCLYSQKLTKDIAGLPHVRRVAGYVGIFLAPVDRHGHPVLPAPLYDNEVETIGSVEGQYFSQDGMIADQGRVPNRDDPNEIALTAQAAALLHWHVGQVVPMAAFSYAQVTAAGLNLPQGPPIVRLDAKVSGIVTFTDAVVHDEVDQFPTFVVSTPALTRTLIARGGAGFTTYTLRLDGGGRNVTAVEHELIGLVPPGSLYNFHVTSVVEGQVERAAKPVSIALAVFGSIAALAALLIAGQVIARSLRTGGRDQVVLRALGAAPAATVSDAVLGMLGAIVVGAALAAFVSVAASPLTPVGAVRQVDPSPGFHADWTVLAVGCGLAVVALSVFAVGFAALMVRGIGREDTERPGAASSLVVQQANRMGLPVSSAAGIGFAVERGRGAQAVPVGSALTGAVIAVAVVVTTLTFGSSLGALVSQPALYGWNWDYAVTEASGGQVPPVATRMLDADRRVAAWAGFNFGDAQVDGQTVPIIIATREDSPISPPVLSGHGLRGDHQIVLGKATLLALHKHVGDVVTLSYGLPQDAPAYLPPTPLRIVGTATLPAVGASQTLHTSMGFGALVSAGAAPGALQGLTGNPDPDLNGPTMVVVKLRPGVPAQAGRASLQRIADATTRFVDQHAGAGSGTFLVLPVQQPAEIVNYKSIGVTPFILASVIGVGAAVALVLTLVASVRRRRRDLALFKTFGFVERQLAAVVAWQASTVALVGVVVGIPIGIVLGRMLWDLFARQIYAVPLASVPVAEIAMVAVGALILANIVALVPGRLAARTATASLLRAE